MVTPKPLRVGIVGTGAIAQKHLAAILPHADQVVISAICDPNTSALETFGAFVPDAKRFTAVDDLIASGVIDAGIIATPHFLHFSQAFSFASASIPVLVEKPLVTTLDQLRQLRDIADKTGTLVVAGQMHRFDRTNVLGRRWLDLDSSRFGALESFELHCWQDITEYTEQVGLSHWLLNGELAGGGVIVSLAIHQLDLLRFLGGTDYAEVSAKGLLSAPFHAGAESSASVLVTMQNGATGSMFASYTAPRRFASESVTLFGQNGGLTRQLRGLGTYLGPLLYAPAHDIEGVIDFSAAAAADAGVAAIDAGLVADLGPERFENQILHFTHAVRGDVEPLNTLAQNFNSIACIDAINQSLRESGRPIAVASE
ncbi:Gfo/Idh/MocA family protein [Rathayibacter soli]|uniref:Gfo/Idh/MocA family protein n=1 Tax=Rathayibacter soli TaxID=3144168 RepID=UPI0027E4C9B4|nr:Gfo/Idh/MocA family oxidoreductase [Glaciibacter superstes]